MNTYPIIAQLFQTCDVSLKVSIKNISALVAAFGASFEHFDKSIETWEYQIVNDDLRVERIPDAEYSPFRLNQAHFGINVAKPGAEYHWKLKYDNNGYQGVWIGIIEADKANVYYTNHIQNKGFSYLWFSGGYYHYGIDKESYLMNKYIYSGNCYDIWLDLINDDHGNYNIIFGQDGNKFDWKDTSMGNVKKDKQYRLAVVFQDNPASTAAFEIIEFDVKYKSID